MSATVSYANILHTVGQILDQAGVKSIAVQEEEDGLFVEGFNADGQLQIQMRLDIASLSDLINRTEHELDASRLSADNGTLRRFLADRELVGASR
jgi:hypothetical protein